MRPLNVSETQNLYGEYLAVSNHGRGHVDATILPSGVVLVPNPSTPNKEERELQTCIIRQIASVRISPFQGEQFSEQLKY
jgi:hypothetical protein